MMKDRGLQANALGKRAAHSAKLMDVKKPD